MTEAYLMYFATADNAMIREKKAFKGLPDIQNHVIICDGNTGIVHRVTALKNMPAEYHFADAKIVAQTDRSQIVYFEYLHGPSGFVESEIARLPTPEAQERVRDAYQRYCMIGKLGVSGKIQLTHS